MLTGIKSLGRSLFPRGHAPEELDDFDIHLAAAIEWIRTAHSAIGESGISKGYDTLRRRWDHAYPETTGYTIPTLLNAAGVFGDNSLRVLALRLADYLLSIAGKDGGVSHWAAEKPNPVVFDTGQVIFGFLAAHKATGNIAYLDAARRGGNWLCSIQDPTGSWKKGQHLGVEKVIDTRVAWALLCLHASTKDAKYKQAAVANLEWALSHQHRDGWFSRCSFTIEEDPFTHTLAYTAEGFLECGKLLSAPHYVEAASRTSDALLRNQRSDGSLASTFGPAWEESSPSSCLTGNCQSAKLWLDFFELEGDPAHFAAAKKSLAFVASRQVLDKSLAGIHGGIPGSAPFFGIYERFKYPNWAAKFFVDAVMNLHRVNACKPEFPFAG